MESNIKLKSGILTSNAGLPNAAKIARDKEQQTAKINKQKELSSGLKSFNLKRNTREVSRRQNYEESQGQNRGWDAQRMKEQLKSAYDDRGRPIKSYWDNLYIQNSLDRMGGNYNESDFIQGYKPTPNYSDYNPRSFEDSNSQRGYKSTFDPDRTTLQELVHGKESDRHAFAAAIKRYPNAKISYGNGVIENNPNNTKVNKKSNINY